MLNFLLLLMLTRSSKAQPRKCCSRQFSVDVSDPTYPQCSRSKTHSSSSSFNQTIPPKLPNCKAEYEVLPLGTENDQWSDSLSWVDDAGSLVTVKYGDELKIDNYCIDNDMNTGKPLAVICDPCKEKVSSI